MDTDLDDRVAGLYHRARLGLSVVRRSVPAWRPRVAELMEAVFKKYFWVLNLAVLGAVAWLVAQTAVDFVRAKYLGVPSSPPEVSASATLEAPVTKGSGEVAQALTDRRPFNVDPPQDDTPKSEDCKPSCDEKKCGPDGCGGSCGDCAADEVCAEETGLCGPKDDEAKASELNVQLQGTLVHPVDPTIRWANVLVSGEPQLLAVGTEVLGGQAKVLDIQPKMLYLQEGERLTFVSLWAETAADAPGRNPNGAMRTNPNPGGPQLNRPNPGEGINPDANAGGAPPPPKDADFAQHVKKESETSFSINRQMLDEQLQDLTALGMQARVIPNYRNGKYEGFKLVGVRPGSLYRAIGIRSGDIIRSINGKAINSPNKAMELFSEFKSANSINLEVERRGQIQARSQH